MEKCDILGVNISAVNMCNTVKIIEENINDIKGKYICVSNVHTTVTSYEDSKYRVIQNEAFMALPDGKPLSVVCRMKGYKQVARVTGPDLMEEIFTLSEEKGYTHYFYGSTDETLITLKNKLLQKHPKLIIKGMYSPPFRELSVAEDKEIVDRINSSNADFLWVGLGAPKQEIWMNNHSGKVNSLMIGVGAGFDYHAGNIRRAPKLMQKLSLEWLYRLVQDPKRLAKRYMITNNKFIYLLLKNSISKSNNKISN